MPLDDQPHEEVLGDPHPDADHSPRLSAAGAPAGRRGGQSKLRTSLLKPQTKRLTKGVAAKAKGKHKGIATKAKAKGKPKSKMAAAEAEDAAEPPVKKRRVQKSQEDKESAEAAAACEEAANAAAKKAAVEAKAKRAAAAVRGHQKRRDSKATEEAGGAAGTKAAPHAQPTPKAKGAAKAAAKATPKAKGAAKAAAMCKRPARESSRPAVTARPALGEASGVSPAAGTSAAKAKGGRPSASGGRKVDALAAKYPWGREGGPPPASEAELQSLVDQMARLRKDRKNFARPDRPDAERLAHAEAMLHIMMGKARAGFGEGRAMATHGLSRSAGLVLAKRARKLALALEARFDPEAAPSVLIREGMTLLDAD